jgi:type II secretory pathway component GspD/PulD (secretin)
VIVYQPTGDVSIKVFKLSHLGASDVIGTVKNTYPMVMAQASPNNDAVIVHANSAMLKEISVLISGIDIPKPEVSDVGPKEKVEVVKMKYAEAEASRDLLKTLLGADAPATMEVDKRLNALVMKGYEAQIERAKSQLEDIDVPLQQVMISVKVIDLSETGGKSLGIDWQVGANDGTQPINWYEVPNAYPNTVAGGYNPYTGAKPSFADSPVGFFIRDPFVLRSAISFAVSKGEAKVLASPRVAALDGEKATLHIGDRYPIVYYDPRAGQYQVIYVDIGIRLDVTPKISPDGYISAKINTTVSDLRELVNNQYPRTTERSAELTIRVKDNNTIVIGGMIQESSRDNVKKVPFLGDIPILGEMFKQSTTDRAKGEVVIMITPKIITQ